MKEVSYTQYGKELMEQLPKGAFMNVQVGDEKNTMTIGWGSLSFIWGKPVFMAMVRYSRHTYKMVEEAGCFTISVPLNGQLKKELGFCGTKSGRDVDKFEELSLAHEEAHHVKAPLLTDCDLQVECKVVFKQAMNPELVDDTVKEACYKDGNYHVMYYGEVLGTYIKE